MARRQALFAEHATVLAAYGLLTYVFTYPALTRPFTHIPGKGDAPWFLWDLWWFKHALVDLGQSPYFTDLLFHPHGRVPITGETPINEFGAIPLQLLLGDVVPVYNLLFFASFVLSGWFTYLLLRRRVARPEVAFIGGMVFAFCGYRAARALGHLSLLTTQFMPLALLVAERWWRAPTLPRAVALGVTAGAVALSNPYYVPYFLGPVALAAALWGLGWARHEARDRRRWSGVAVAGLTCFAVTAPAYVHYLDFDPAMRASLASVAPEIESLSADVLSYLLPSGEHALWGRYTAPLYARFASPNLVETTLFLGLLPALLALASFALAAPGRAVRFWQILAALAFALSLGPTLHVLGAELWRWMPYDLLLRIPGFESFRAPSRIGVTTSLAVAVLASLVADRALARVSLPRVKLVLAIWALALLVNLPFRWPFLLADARIPEMHQRIAEAPGQFAVLELPAGPYHLADMSWHMHRQSAHRRPLVSGYINRGAKHLRDIERTAPFVQRFFTGDREHPVRGIAKQEALAGRWPQDVLEARRLLADLGVGRVVLHPQVNEWSYWRPATQLLFRALGMPDEVEGGTLLWVVDPAGSSSEDLADVQWHEGAGESSWRAHRVERSIRNTARASIVTPVDGNWCVRGLLGGAQISGLRFRIDDDLVSTDSLRLEKDTLAFEGCLRLAAGPHEFTIEGGPLVLGDFHVAR